MSWYDAEAKIKPFPACVTKATRLLGNDKYVVFPNVRRKFAQRLIRSGVQPFRIQSILEETDAVVSGSFLLRHLMYRAKWEPNDLDIFINERDVNQALFYMWKPDTIIGSSYGNSPIIKIYEWSSKGMSVKIQLIVIKDAVSTEEYVADFDLDIIRSFYDGRFIWTPWETHEALKKTEATHRHITTEERKYSGVGVLEFADRVEERIQKYVARGFDVRLPRKVALSDNEQTLKNICKGHWLDDYYKQKGGELWLRKKNAAIKLFANSTCSAPGNGKTC